MENGAKKEIKLKNIRASLPSLFLAPIWVSNFFAGPFITASLNQQGRAESRDKVYCICVCVILNLFLLLLTILSLFLPTIIIKSNVKTREGKNACWTWSRASYNSRDYCQRRDFAQRAKSRGGTLVTRAYVKESTYSWNIQSYSQCRKKSRFAWTGAARNRQVMMTFLLFAPAGTKWLGWRRTKNPKGIAYNR